MPLRFTGQYSDPETGLFYNYFRDYDSSIGRYPESDPIGLRGGINTYRYPQDPLTRIDPFGLFDWNVFGQFAGQAGLHLIAAGVNGQIGVAVVLPNGQICRFWQVCVRLGPGLFAGAGGSVGGGVVSGGGEGIGGVSAGVGGDLGAGPAIGGQASIGLALDPAGGVRVSGVGAAKGKGGWGYGFSIGVDVCYTDVKCTKPLCQ